MLKAYLALFVCFSTKAVRLELVSSLNVEAFLSTLDRFIARRGLPQEIWSDNGKNFVGSARYISEVSHFLGQNNSDISEKLASKSIKWKFIPPYAPHFGGLWEAGVKSAKRLLFKMLGTTACTFEELATIFARIEAVLNSRPICPLSKDPSESVDFLTPGHFLIGAPLLSSPELSYDEFKTPLNRWEQHKKLFQQFWKKWSSDYLHTMLQRNKWHSENVCPSEGDLVLIKGVESSSATWPIGRILKLYPGPDGIIRVASVKTATGQYTRALTKLVPFNL
ncbi:uncharacterized protein LOC123683495 [Harmonia axyridis]|uniref:uncharacterized protein LOC123683495 n=1 Tax=Harmonia axyridis TaxID=115357 RepID=UPI001E275DFD|nr:uncharacterized protein LOC123683495 [Harmonia axyridis]